MSFEMVGVVVLYNPNDKVKDNILSYLPWLNRLIVVDNSPSLSPSLKSFLLGSKKIFYHGEGFNRGMAWALNFGAHKALELQCGWLLTMDQDSRFEAGALDMMTTFCKGQQRVGIVSPFHRLAGTTSEKMEIEARETSCVMTSGNLLNLEAYQSAGPFLEKLFVDYVDFEYCLRLRKFAYKIWTLPKAILFHSLGELESHRFLMFVFNPTNHSPERRYYITRNRLYVMSRYPHFVVAEGWAWMKELVKLFLFEKQRLLKLRYMGRGALDFLRNRYGPLDKIGF